MPYRLASSAVLLALVVSTSASGQGRGRQWFTYDEAFGGAGRAAPVAGLDALPQVTGWLDDEHWLETREGKVYKVRAADGTATVHRDPAALADVAPKGIVNNPVASRTADDSRRVYVVGGDLWVVDVAGRSARRLTQTPGLEQTPTLSPDGRQVAFTRGGNLFTVDVTSGLERQLTADGSDTILNGYASWVYFEEILGRAGA